MRIAMCLVPLFLGISACSTALSGSPDPVAQDAAIIDEAFPPAILELNFDVEGARLNGILYQANGAGPHPTVMLLHGYPGNEKNLDLAQAMRRAGYNILFFHYRGAWGSGGSFSFSHVVEDVGHAARMLRSRAVEYRVDPDRFVMIGHSMGGFAALQGAALDSEIDCVAALAPADFGVLASAPEIADAVAKGASDLTMLDGWTEAAALNDLRQNADTFSLTALAPRLSDKSVLLIAGHRDAVLPPDLFHTPLVDAYAAQSGLQLEHHVLNGDHSFSESRILLIRTVLDWADRCTDR